MKLLILKFEPHRTGVARGGLGWPGMARGGQIAACGPKVANLPFLSGRLLLCILISVNFQNCEICIMLATLPAINIL